MSEKEVFIMKKKLAGILCMGGCMIASMAFAININAQEHVAYEQCHEACMGSADFDHCTQMQQTRSYTDSQPNASQVRDCPYHEEHHDKEPCEKQGTGHSDMHQQHRGRGNCHN